MTDRLSALQGAYAQIMNEGSDVESIEEAGEPEWNDELRDFAYDHLCEALGVDDLSRESVGQLQHSTLAEKLKGLFEFPGELADTPFQKAEEFWWESVADTIGRGNLYNFQGKPNYDACLEGWRGRIAETYGFEPTDHKDEKFQEQMEQAVADAARALSALRRGTGDPESASRAGKLLRGRHDQRQRRAIMNRG